MNYRNTVLIIGVSILLFFSCKLIGRTAAKYWTKKQIKEFVTNCESKAAPFVGDTKAANYCDCAVDVIAKEYNDYDKAKNVSIREVIRLTKECK